MNSKKIEVDRLSGGYPALISYLLDEGDELPSRNGKVKELVASTLVVTEPKHCIVGRKGFSRCFMDLEIQMLLAGTYEPELVRATTPQAAALTTPLTAYGPRVRDQVPYVIRELQEQPHSRRAVVYIGARDDLSELYGSDVDLRAFEMPCTMTWQFLLRDNALHMVVNMRSWDAVWGLSYDVPCFVAVQMAVAKALDAPLGIYAHHAGSLHLYEQHWGIEVWDNEEQGELEIGWLARDYVQTRRSAARLLDARRELEVTR